MALEIRDLQGTNTQESLQQIITDLYDSNQNTFNNLMCRIKIMNTSITKEGQISPIAELKNMIIKGNEELKKKNTK